MSSCEAHAHSVGDALWMFQCNGSAMLAQVIWMSQSSSDTVLVRVFYDVPVRWWYHIGPSYLDVPVLLWYHVGPKLVICRYYDHFIPVFKRFFCEQGRDYTRVCN